MSPPATEQATRQAQARTAALTRDAASSFYWAMRLMERQRRQAMFAIYAFCRIVDDIADDEGAAPAARKVALEEWRGRVEALYEGRAEHFVARALAPAIEAFGLRKADFLAVIDGMEMDAEGPLVAPPEAVLDLYCDRVASAVGRLSVRVFGEGGELGERIAHHQGRALQLANILRDVAEDAELGRLYLPRELLSAHGIGWSDPRAVMGQPGFAALWRELAARAQEHFTETKALFAQSRADMRTARIMLAIYERNLRRMMALSDAELADPARSKRLVGKGEKLLVALGIWLGGRA